MDNMSILLVVLVVLVLLLFIWGMNKDQLNRELRKTIIEYGMFHNKSMVYYIMQSRKNRRLIHKYNVLFLAISRTLDEFGAEDRINWLDDNKINISDFKMEYEDDSNDKEVNDTVIRANEFVKRNFKKKKKI